MAKPKPSKYSRARIRSKVRRPKRAGASRGWMITTIALVLVGALLVVLSYNDRRDRSQAAPKLGDHFHAYLGVNICGKWEPAIPLFEGRDGSNDPNATPRAGIHSHADFLIHDHPFSSDESGAKATLGRYLGYAQTELSSTAIKLSSQWVPNVNFKNGQKCPGAKKSAEVQWVVGRYQQPWPTKAQTGNPADHHIKDGDIIAIYFLPKGDKLEQPPGSEAALANVNDAGAKAPAGTSSTSSPTPPASDAGSTSSSGPAGSGTSTTP